MTCEMSQEETFNSFAFVSTRLVLQTLQALGKSNKQVGAHAAAIEGLPAEVHNAHTCL